MSLLDRANSLVIFAVPLLLTLAPACSRSGGGDLGEVSGTPRGRTSASASPAPLPPPDSWGSNIDAALTQARAEKRPVLVHFHADWCGACLEMNKNTFLDDAFRDAASRFIPVKVDLTNEEDPRVQAMKTKWKIHGMPVVILFDSQGEQVKRFEKSLSPEDLISAMRDVR